MRKLADLKNCFSIRLLLMITLAVVLILASAICCVASQNDTLRIGLVRNLRTVKQVSVCLTSSFNVMKTGADEPIISCNAGSPCVFEADGNSITVKSSKDEPVNCGACVTISSSDQQAVTKIDSPERQSKQYRGMIEISAKCGALCIVNVINVEDYLLGVLPAEMPPSYPAEALKAQAIAARTFVLKNRNKHTADGYDVCDRDHCQTYGGVASEDARTTKALQTTSGVVLTYNKQLASTMYSTDCGGTTQNYSDVYPNSKFPYLCGVTDPAELHKDCWEKSYSIQELAEKLTKAGVKEANNLKSITVTKNGSSGRVLTLDIVGGEATKSIYAETLRRSLGYDIIKSTLFTIESTEEGKITFKGKGYGHGVGMCQIGAKGLANAPYNYTCEQILSHYFPGTQISGSFTESPAMKMAKANNDEAVAAKPQQISSDDKKRKATKPAKPAARSEKVIFEVRVKAPENF